MWAHVKRKGKRRANIRTPKERRACHLSTSFIVANYEKHSSWNSWSYSNKKLCNLHKCAFKLCWLRDKNTIRIRKKMTLSTIRFVVSLILNVNRESRPISNSFTFFWFSLLASDLRFFVFAQLFHIFIERLRDFKNDRFVKIQGEIKSLRWVHKIEKQKKNKHF